MQAVIFDMDGVIVDSEPVHIHLERSLFNELGINLAPGEQKSYMGTSGTNMFTLLKERHDLTQSVESLLELARSRFLNHLKNKGIPLVDGAKNLIQHLHKSGRTLAVASSAPHSHIDMVMEQNELGQYFRCRVSGEDVEQSKPHPEIFLRTASYLDAAPEKCWVIEDTENGVSAAIAAGMTCIGFANPSSGDENLSAAHFVVDRLSEVPAILNLTAGS